MSESNKVDGSIIGDLLLEEVPYWQAGVCQIKVSPKDEILVFGENDHIIERVPADSDDEETATRESDLDGREVLDLEAIAEQVNEAVEEEHDAL